jgi:hypothetical protein
MIRCRRSLAVDPRVLDLIFLNDVLVLTRVISEATTSMTSIPLTSLWDYGASIQVPTSRIRPGISSISIWGKP